MNENKKNKKINDIQKRVRTEKEEAGNEERKGRLEGEREKGKRDRVKQ